ncbi:hypothetical protein VPLG_00159 [Vibrio phage eugene 12A10]|uniref:hypothetical protein n=1 Tax=Vibrio phage eugene 12A10 TaxID=573172 RepID=UPI0003516650|nr:hypothetical protein VPLG_00159 [Vibrio phage eugene 12A10]AGN51598.1 hypothetical protein VPLG_00159 [Vibrio phage eugene 12A10]
MYEITKPSGEIVWAHSYTGWCKKEGLSKWGFRDILSGKQKQTLGGYTIRKKSENKNVEVEEEQPKPSRNALIKIEKENINMSLVKHEQKVITPQLAEKLLEHNTRNRKISQPKVDQYVKDMIAGGWVENGESIKFDDTGRLIDGQHRLTACVQSGVPFITTLTTGLSDPNAFKTIDTGRTRGADQVLQMAGVKNPNNVAAAVRIVMAWDLATDKTKHVVRTVKGTTNHEVLEKVYEFKEETLLEGLRLSKTFPSSCGNSVLHGAYLILSRISDNRAEEFYNKLEDGLFSSKQDPCKLLTDRIYNRVGNWTKEDERTELLALIFKAYNWHCESNFTQKRLVWDKSSKFPVPYGVKH